MRHETFKRYPPPLTEAERQARLAAALGRIPADQRAQAISQAADQAILPFLGWGRCRGRRHP